MPTQCSSSSLCVQTVGTLSRGIRKACILHSSRMWPSVLSGHFNIKQDDRESRSNKIPFCSFIPSSIISMIKLDSVFFYHPIQQDMGRYEEVKERRWSEPLPPKRGGLFPLSAEGTYGSPPNHDPVRKDWSLKQKKNRGVKTYASYSISR